MSKLFEHFQGWKSLTGLNAVIPLGDIVHCPVSKHGTTHGHHFKPLTQNSSTLTMEIYRYKLTSNTLATQEGENIWRQEWFCNFIIAKRLLPDSSIRGSDVFIRVINMKPLTLGYRCSRKMSEWDNIFLSQKIRFYFTKNTQVLLKIHKFC